MATLLDTTPVSDLANERRWGVAYAATYEAASQQKQQRRQRRRTTRTREPSAKAIDARAARLAAAQARIDTRFAEAQQRPGFTAKLWEFITSQARAGDPDARLLWRTDAEPIFAELRRARHVARREEVRLRSHLGYRWLGGPVGGNPAYARAPLVYAGLVSDEHPILKLFVASTPQAKHLQTGDTKAKIDRVGQKLLALDSAYVAGNEAMCRILRVEVDQSFPGGFAGLAAAVAECGVPLPNLAVGHVNVAGQLLNPHLIWLLEHPVVFTTKGRPEHQALWHAVLNGLTAALLPIGADPGGRSNALRMKNPLCPAWHRQVLAAAPYTLTPDTRAGAAGLVALAPSLDLNSARAVLQQATEAHRSKLPAADHPDPAIAGQSNALFRHLSTLARNRIGWHRDEGNGCQEAFRQELLAAALAVVSDPHDGERHVAATVRNVAGWTWDRYRQAPVRSPCATPEERHARQAAGQAKAATTRSAATLAALIKAAKNLDACSQRLTKTAIAAAAGCCIRTVQNHWPAILEARQAPPTDPAVQVAIDKKGSVGGASLSGGDGVAPPPPLMGWSLRRLSIYSSPHPARPIRLPFIQYGLRTNGALRTVFGMNSGERPGKHRGQSAQNIRLALP